MKECLVPRLPRPAKVPSPPGKRYVGMGMGTSADRPRVTVRRPPDPPPRRVRDAWVPMTRRMLCDIRRRPPPPRSGLMLSRLMLPGESGGETELPLKSEFVLRSGLVLFSMVMRYVMSRDGPSAGCPVPDQKPSSRHAPPQVSLLENRMLYVEVVLAPGYMLLELRKKVLTLKRGRGKKKKTETGGGTGVGGLASLWG